MNNASYIVKFLMITILLLAAAPRAIELINGNYLFGYDQGEHFQAVKKIVVDQKLTLIGTQVGGAGGFFQGPGWYYLLAIPFLFTGGDPYGAMVLMFVIGMLTVFFGYYFGNKMFGQWSGVAIAFLIGVSPAIIAQSRFIWPPFPIYFLSVFFLFFIYSTFQKRVKFFPLATFVVGLMAHFEIATAGLFFGHLILLVPFLLLKKILSFRYFIISIFSLILPFTPLILFDLRHQFLISKGILAFITGSQNPSHEVSFFYILKMLENHYSIFKYNFIATFSPDIIHAVIFVFLIVGIILIVGNKSYSFAKRMFVLYLAVSPILFFILSMIYLWPMWDWWIRHLQIYYIFLLGIVLAALWQGMTSKLIILTVIIAIFSTSITYTIDLYKRDFNDYGGTNKIKGKLQAIDHIYTDAKGEPFGVLIFSPPIYTYPYDYLFWWYGEKRHHYRPHNEKKGTFYLLIEGDPHQPWTYEGWMETVIKTGRVVETKTLFPSGFIIQKRIAEDVKK